MKNTENIPYSFLRKIEDSIFKKDEIPLIAGFYPLDIRAFEKQLGDVLKIDHLKFSIKSQERLVEEEILKGFSEKSKVNTIVLSPLASPVFLVIDEPDTKKLLSWSIPIKGFESKPLEESFFLFTLLNALESIEEQGFIQGLSPKLTKGSLPKEGLCIDLELKKENTSILLRLCLSDSFRKEWNNYYKNLAPYQISKELSSITDISLSLALGAIAIDESDFSSIKKGDFVALDKIYYDPGTQKGSLRMMLEDHPLFRAKIAENKIKILEYSHHHEDLIMSEEENIFEEKTPSTNAHPPAPKKMRSIQDVPFEITVEVAKFSMPLSELKQIQPGNYLPLTVTPDEGVMLSVNNKMIGKGELVYLGDTLGVRITEWGSSKRAVQKPRETPE